MTQERLTTLINRPETQRKILRGYRGAYSLGLTLNPGNRGEIAIRVRIEGDDSSHIAKSIVLDGRSVPVLVNTGFRTPHAAPATVSAGQ